MPLHDPLHGMRPTRIGRAAPVVRAAASASTRAVLTTLGGARTGTERHLGTAAIYAEHLSRSKGALMKAAQILSFTDLHGAVDAAYQPAYGTAVRRLRPELPAMAADTTIAVVEAELRAPVSALFAHFDPDPIGVASIGQVHAATLFDGTPVAVKVQYPGVAHAIRADLRNGELLAAFLQMVSGFAPGLARMDLRAIAREVSMRILEELDYHLEAAHQAQFAAAYSDHPFIHVPPVHPTLSTGRVLTMGRAQGRRLDEVLDADAALRDCWGEAIVRFSTGSIRHLGLFHADPHPGNLLFHDDGAVTFLDFGSVKRFTTSQVRALQRALNAAVDSDIESIVPALDALGLGVDTQACGPWRVLEWFRRGLENLTGPQPHTFTAGHAAQAVRDKYSPTGPHRAVLRALRTDPHILPITRIDLGLNHMLGALRSTGPWEAIRSEWDRGGPAATPMGATGWTPPPRRR